MMELTLNRESFITSYPPYNVLTKKNIAALWQRRPINVYVHLPFCPKRCGFCYYRVEIPKGENEIDVYVDALLKEIERLAELPELQTCSMRTLYFGGGTPTMLSSDHFVRIVEALKKLLPVTPDFEFCVEVRPGGEATREKLQTLKELNVRRLSIGAQSLDDKILRENGRNHLVHFFYETYDRARECGFDWLNVDILSGLLHETEETWMYTIRALADLRPENISVYKMEVFYNTKLFQVLKNNPQLLISDQAEANNFRRARNWLESLGYFMWNSSSFTVGRDFIHEHRRNIQYGGEMLGIGLSSHSYFNGMMFQNTANMKGYKDLLAQGKLPIHRAYKLTKRDEIVRFVVFSLKNLSLSRNDFYERFGFEVMDLFAKEIRDLADHNMLELTDTHINVASEYYDFADDISRFFYPPEQKEDMLAHMNRKG